MILQALKDFGSKLWNIGKRLVPLYALWEFFVWWVGDFWKRLADRVIGGVQDWIAETQVDISIPVYYYSKVNSVVPLYEAVQYLGLYLGLVLIVTGYKWLRNILPGFS